MATVDTHNSPTEGRYEAYVGDALAGFAEYLKAEGEVVFTHTEVFPHFEGQGVGSALARFALDDVRADGALKVRSECPFISRWMRKHPEYASLRA